MTRIVPKIVVIGCVDEIARLEDNEALVKLTYDSDNVDEISIKIVVPISRVPILGARFRITIEEEL